MSSKEKEFRAIPINNDIPFTETTHSIGVAVVVMLFNNLAAPFIATAFVSSNCFYNVITTPPDVTVSYLYSQCGQYTQDLFNHTLITYCVYYVYGKDVRTTTYVPPFNYSYQCSSTFITTYASIYVFMLIMMGFLAPLVQLLLLWIQRCSLPSSFLNRVACKLLPNILKPYRSLSTMDSWRNTALFSVFDVAFSGRLFDCDVFAVQLMNMLIVLITFGVVVPPLAVVGLVAVYSVTYFTQWCIGRYIVALSKESVDLKFNEVTVALNEIESDCGGASEMFKKSLWLVVPFVVVFYSFLLFDILGDEVGWKKAITLPIVIVCLPGLFLLLRRFSRYTIFGKTTRESRRSWGSDRKSELDEEALDLDEVLLAN